MLKYPRPIHITHDQHHLSRYPTDGDRIGNGNEVGTLAGPENGNPKWMVTGHAPKGNPVAPPLTRKRGRETSQKEGGSSSTSAPSKRINPGCILCLILPCQRPPTSSEI